MPAAHAHDGITFDHVSFAYPTTGEPVLRDFDLTIPAGTSLAIVGQNGAGKTTLAKLLCRLYDPQAGAINVDGIDLRDLDVDGLAPAHHRGVPGLHPLRAARCATTSRRAARPTTRSRPPSPTPGRRGLADLDTPLAKGYAGGTDLSGGQWQRVALARALCAVEAGAGVVLLDEPTAQLDVRGEAEIFERILGATRRLHDDPHLPPVLDRAPRRPHLRARARPGDRARHPRRADGAAAAATARCSTCRPSGSPPAWRRPRRTRRWPSMSSREAPTRPTTTSRRRSRRCGGCASSATSTSPA